MILGTLYFPGRFLSCGGAHTAPTAHIRAVGPGGTAAHCVLKWNFMRTFPANQEGTLK